MLTYLGRILNNYDFNEFTTQENKSSNNFDPNEIILNDQERLSNPIFKAYGYPSKIYYPSIQKYIKAYTKVNGVVLDSTCGSGTTGIAALLENRKVILNDNSPQAINLTYNTLNPIDIKLVEKTHKKLMDDLKGVINGLYETYTEDGKLGYADVIITSNIYSCPNCNQEIVLYYEVTGKRSEYKCTNCSYIINISKKEDKERLIERRRPVEVTIKINDKTSSKKTEKRPIKKSDLDLWERNLSAYEENYGHLWCPEEKIVYNRCYPRVGGWPGFPIDASVSDLFPKKNLMALKILYNYIETQISDKHVQAFFMFIFTESLFRSSKRLFTTSGIKNVYHVPPLGKESNVLSVFERKYKVILKAKQFIQNQLPNELVYENLRIIKGDAKKLPLENNSVDYAFIDPPYGGVVPYAELNLFYSAWLKEKEDLENEIIIPMDYEKKIEYVKIWGKKIEEAFQEVYRVLKPGAYFTIVFQSKFNDIWNELRDLMSNRIGFQFVNILENERSTTFHTNSLNDTNPKSAFITYRKPLSDEHLQFSIDDLGHNVFEQYPLSHLETNRTFREIQSKIISLVHEKNLDEVPSDDQIKAWLKEICIIQGESYILKKV